MKSSFKDISFEQKQLTTKIAKKAITTLNIIIKLATWTCYQLKFCKLTDNLSHELIYFEINKYFVSKELKK